MPQETSFPGDTTPGHKSGFGCWRLLKRMLFLFFGFVVIIAGLWFLFPRQLQRWAAAGMEQIFPRYLAWRSGTGSFEGGVRPGQMVKVPMRDGIQLATDLYLPDARGPFPTIAIRTPYTKGEGKPVGEFFARYGYAVGVQDVRGRHASEGDFYPFRAEVEDGIDFTRWLKKQPWCNGKIGAFGGSYVGFTQWAMAVGNPDLSAIAPTFITANLYNGIYDDGAFGKLTFLHWSLTSYGRYGDMGGAANILKGYSHFPLIESDDVAGKDIPFFNDWVSHPTPDSYWHAMNVDHRFAEMSAPALLTAGWYDFFRDEQLNDFQLFQKTAPVPARGETKLLIGPWNHAFFNGNQDLYGIQQRKLEVIPFDFVREVKAWYDYSLKGISNGWDRRALARIYVLGKNDWRDEQQWPPARAMSRSYYLHSAGKAHTLDGDGSIDENLPAAPEPPDSFVYDPRRPAPTKGGSHGLPADCGPADQREVEHRPDVLVYSSRALTKPLLVMGKVMARIHASSTALDTDFTAKLVDVFPDGQALIVCDGIVRARYRKGLDKPELMQAGKVYPFTIPVGNTAVLFKAGHRIRVEISSSNFPRYDANPNTGADIATERHPIPATQNIFHGNDFPSTLILPVVEE
jgi:putative CocE/NonD family hydrolase